MTAARLLTGITGLDEALGGGLAMGQVIEVFGTAGVTGLGLRIAAAGQKAGHRVAWVGEGIGILRAEGCGIDLSRLMVSIPPAEKALSIVWRFLEADAEVVIMRLQERPDPDDGWLLKSEAQWVRKILGLAMTRGALAVCLSPARGSNAAKFYAGTRIQATMVERRATEEPAFRLKVVKHKHGPVFGEAVVGRSELECGS